MVEILTIIEFNIKFVFPLVGFITLSILALRLIRYGTLENPEIAFLKKELDKNNYLEMVNEMKKCVICKTTYNDKFDKCLKCGTALLKDVSRVEAVNNGRKGGRKCWK